MNKYILVLILLMLLFTGAYYFLVIFKNYKDVSIDPDAQAIVSMPVDANNYPELSAQPIGGVVEFEGVQTAFVESCYVDATCTATVGKYQIITNPGDVGAVVLGQSNLSKQTIGKTVKVKAIKVSEGMLTIVGREDLYANTVD